MREQQSDGFLSLVFFRETLMVGPGDSPSTVAMVLWARLSRWRRWLSWRTSSRSQAASRVLVSVYVQSKAMAPQRLSHASRRILLTTSVWSVVVLVVVFFLVYTLLLVSVEQPSLRASGGRDPFPGQGTPHARPRVRFLGRGPGSRNWSALSFAHQRRQFWDPGQPGGAAGLRPVCRRGSLFLVLITSAPDHFQHRQEIRQSWCRPSLSRLDRGGWQCVFLIGQANSSALAARLREEGQRHGDVLQGSYLDSYRNLTRKVMHGLAWASSLCQAPYLLKTDDDCFANTVLLQQFLLHHNTQTSSLYAGGMVVRKEKRKVIRRAHEKWAVSPEDYLPDYYPMYASGSGYILSVDVVSRAVEESRYVKPIPNEDAYMGILMDRLGVVPTLSGRFTLSSSGLRVCNFLYIFVAHGVGPALHRQMCDQMVAAQKKCLAREEVTDW